MFLLVLNQKLQFWYCLKDNTIPNKTRSAKVENTFLLMLKTESGPSSVFFYGTLDKLYKKNVPREQHLVFCAVKTKIG